MFDILGGQKGQEQIQLECRHRENLKVIRIKRLLGKAVYPRIGRQMEINRQKGVDKKKSEDMEQVKEGQIITTVIQPVETRMGEGKVSGNGG